MKLEKIFGNLNQIEKGSFLKILDQLSNDARGYKPEVDNILSDNCKHIKEVDDENLIKLFFAVREEYKQFIKTQFELNDSQLPLFCSILTRDGNSMMSRDWLNTLYRKDYEKLQKNIEIYKNTPEEVVYKDSIRFRDYEIFRNCVKVAYQNDSIFNHDNTVSREEKTILNELASQLDLSNDEKQLIYFSQVPLVKLDVDNIIGLLKDAGICFYSKRKYQIYVPDEIVHLLREVQGISLPNKYFRRILRQLTDNQINKICRKHGINLKIDRESKIIAILESGVSVRKTLLRDIHPDNMNKTELKKFLASLIEKLDINLSKSGSTAEERLEFIINYYNHLEYDENISISLGGYNKMLTDMAEVFPDLPARLKEEFELQQDNVLDTELLLDYCIKPLDIVYLLTPNELKLFCSDKEIKTRGGIIKNIIGKYKDLENLHIENIELISSRDINALKEKGITIKEGDLGLRFEKVTSKIFSNLGFHIDEELKNNVNTSKNKIDHLINIGNNKVIIVECKTVKDKLYNKYSACSRQLQSYIKLCKDNKLDVMHTILVAHDFSDDFVESCEDDYNLPVTLISAKTLSRILKSFRQSNHDTLPLGILKKGGLLDAERICKSLER